jgi:hypothetical protein
VNLSGIDGLDEFELMMIPTKDQKNRKDDPFGDTEL